MWPEKEEEAKRELISMIHEFCETYKGKKCYFGIKGNATVEEPKVTE